MSEDQFEEQIREILKKIRKEQVIRQKELAEVIGVNTSYIGQVETGKARLSMYQFLTILKHYGYKPIFDDDGGVRVFREI